MGVDSKVKDTVGGGSIRASQEATAIEADTELGLEIQAVRELMAKNRLASQQAQYELTTAKVSSEPSKVPE